VIIYLNRRRSSPPYAAFDQRMSELGYIEGRNLAVEFLNPSAEADGVSEAMRELVRRKVDVILAPVESALKSALATTNTLPIVMLAIDYDPLTTGYVTSLARPGTNVTGIYFQQIELAMKRLQVMMDALPGIQAATVFWDVASAGQWRVTQSAAKMLRLRLAGVELREWPYDYERALDQVTPDHRRALLVMTSAHFFFDRARLANFAAQHRLPAMFALREWVEADGLMSYGPSITGLYRRVAELVDRIARGAKPAELPVEQPTKFELVINLKTARTLGLTMPRDFLLIADEVIE
jgi:putative tryptophan/tyrosine transport system substrate-binding protein